MRETWYLTFMQTIELNPEEAEVLREVLQQNLAEIEVEIFRTDTHDFKEKLKHRRGSMEHIVAKLSSAAVAV